jgi:hypothetical protein
MTEKRTPTAVDLIAERWVDTLCELDPDFRIWLGRDGDVTAFADYSPNGHAAYSAAVSSTLTALQSTDAVDDVDRRTVTCGETCSRVIDHAEPYHVEIF